MNRSNKISDENFKSLVHLMKSNSRIIVDNMFDNMLKVEHIFSYKFNHKEYVKSELLL